MVSSRYESKPWMKPAVSCVEIGRRELHAERRVALAARQRQVQLLFVETGVVAPAAVVRSDHDAAEVGRVAGVRERELAAIELVRPGFQLRGSGRGKSAGAAWMTLTAPCIAPEPYTTPAGPRSTSIELACSLLTSNSSFTLQKPGGADRDAVLQEQEHAARARAASAPASGSP